MVSPRVQLLGFLSGIQFPKPDQLLRVHRLTNSFEQALVFPLNHSKLRQLDWEYANAPSGHQNHAFWRMHPKTQSPLAVHMAWPHTCKSLWLLSEKLQVSNKWLETSRSNCFLTSLIESLEWLSWKNCWDLNAKTVEHVIAKTVKLFAAGFAWIWKTAQHVPCNWKIVEHVVGKTVALFLAPCDWIGKKSNMPGLSGALQQSRFKHGRPLGAERAGYAMLWGHQKTECIQGTVGVPVDQQELLHWQKQHRECFIILPACKKKMVLMRVDAKKICTRTHKDQIVNHSATNKS